MAARHVADFDIARRADADVEFLAFAIEQQAARPVTLTVAGQREDLLPIASGERFRIVLVPLYRRGFADVKIFVPQCESIRLLKPCDHFLALFGIAVRERINRTCAVGQ